MQRALAFDFPDDAVARTTADELMFGAALLVAPVVSSAPSRTVYLPAGPPQWISFWEGR